MMELELPVIELPRDGRITVRTPPIPEVRRWFFDRLGWRIDMGPDPDDLGGVSLARTQLDRVIGILLTEWDAVELFRQYQPGLRCNHRCRYAAKLLCACPCSGEQHGSQAPELPLLGPDGDFDLIGTGRDNWSLVRITHVRPDA
jgi:hypothetical protein